ncbi:MAG: cbb3-type cytochrome c oxidase subunit I [Candidatus Eremiobacteraeota bacterium]|nr:cbb3-type cytochrome c oxidase subunit I [Candidatus Eremiobacteraeota bacterium]
MRVARRGLLVPAGWWQAAVLVILFGFTVLGILAYLTYTDEPPIPTVVTETTGRVLFTGDDIRHGQDVFLKNGLMEYGSIFGHGGYLGPDFTADYLHRAALEVLRIYGGSHSDRANSQTVEDFRTNRFDPRTGRLQFTQAQGAAFRHVLAHYTAYFGEPTTKYGLRPKAVTDENDLHALTAFFAWAAWASAAPRPGETYSYTNNWPSEPLVGNHPTADSLVWSALSLIVLLGGSGLLFAAFGRWNFLGWHGKETQQLSFRPPNAVSLTAGQRACAWFFVVMSLLFLLQTLVGAASEHYRADLSNFFGIDLARIFAYNITRTWHLQLAILWVATAFLAAGIFLAPMIAGSEPRGQRPLIYALLVALTIVVVGSLAGEFAGMHGWVSPRWGWFGNQGFAYLDLGRFWQILLVVGLFFWAAILYRGLRGRLKTEHLANLPWVFFYSALSIPAFYAVGLFVAPHANFTQNDFWRFWVVHLWVEDFLELFTTIMVAFVFVVLGVIEERVALMLVYLDIVIYSVGGVIGTMHHLYFSGEPSIHVALGATFSAAEVIPLTFLTLEAWSFLQLGAVQGAKSRTKFPHYWAVLFLAAVGFWNFLGAGVFGYLINLPIVSYYEIGTALTLNHAHASMMGVYGMLAVGLTLFALRYMIPEERWSDRLPKISFWSLNVGLAWMCFGSMFPLGVLQLYHSVAYGYYDARSLSYIQSGTLPLLEWMRLPGDVLFIVGGVLPIIVLSFRGLYYVLREKPAVTQEVLFTEITETVPAIPISES